MNLNNLLLIDIETVPQHGSAAALSTEWQELWQLKAKRLNIPEDATLEDSYSNNAGIYAEFGKIICISTGYFYTDADKKLKCKLKSLKNDQEVHLLNDFVLDCDKFQQSKRNIVFCGHNIKEFDIPYICRRMMANGLQLPKYLQLNNLKPWETNLMDTMQWWRFGDYKNYTSLRLLSQVLGVPSSKDDIDGSMVRNVYYNEKDLDRIAQYCTKDVQTVAQIIMKYNSRELLSDDDFIR
jgi:3'-5' exonuclease